MSRQATDNLYIELGYFTPEEYYVYSAEARLDAGFYIDPDWIEYNYYEDFGGFAQLSCELTEVEGALQEAEAALSSSATVDAVVGVIKEYAAALNAEFACSGTISHIEGADLFAFAEAALAAAISASRDYEAALSDIFDIATDYVRVRSSDATASNMFVSSAEGARSRDFDSQIEAAVTLEVSANANTKEASASLSATATVSAQTTYAVKLPYTRFENAFSLGALVTPFNPGRPLTQTANTLGAGDYFTNIKKFGTHSALINTNNSVTYGIPNNTSFNNEYLAIEFWIYGSVSNVPLFEVKDSGGTVRYTAITSAASPSNITFQVGSTTAFGGTLTANAWNHILILSHTGTNNVAVYTNGTRGTRATINTGYSLANGSIRIGQTGYAGSAYVDEFRIVRGKTSFPYGWSTANTTVTVPTDRFYNDDRTSLLVHFDANANDDTSILVPVVANFSTETRLSADADTITGLAASITAQASLTASATVVNDAASALASEFAVNAAGGFTIEVSASIDSALTFVINAGALNPGEMEATAIATVVAIGDRTRFGVSELQTVTTQVTDAERLQGIILNLPVSATLTADAIKNKGTFANLQSTASLSATANFKHLQLINGATITAADLDNTLTWLSSKSMANMWLRLSRNLNTNETITIWQSKARGFVSDPTYTSRLVVTKLPSGAYRFTSRRYTVQSEGTYILSVTDLTTTATNIDFTQWHNVTLPLITDSAGAVGSFDGNNSAFNLTTSTSNVLNGYVENSLNPGIWGDSSKTDLSIYINKLWIKQTQFPNVIRNTDFYNDATGWEIAYGTNGVVTSTQVLPNEPGFDNVNDTITPEVYHNWEQGIYETGNNVAPAWNYTKVGTVLTGYTFDFSASAAATSTVSCDIDVIVNADANITATATQSTSARRLRDPGVALSSEFALDITYNRIRSPGARTLSSIFVQNSIARKTARGISNQTVTATQSASGRRVRYADLALSASANFNLPFGEILKTPSAFLNSEFAQSTLNDRFRDNAVQTDSIATQLSVVVKTGQGLVTIDAVAALTADAFKQTDVVSNQVVEAQFSADPIKTVFGAAGLGAEFTSAIAADKIKRVEAALESNFAVAIPGQKITDITGSFNTSAETVFTPNRIRDNAVGLNTTTSLSVPVSEILIFFEASMTAQASGLFVITYLVSARADLQVSGFQLTAGRVINIDDYYTLIVPQETRQIKVQSEDRGLLVKQETRILTV